MQKSPVSENELRQAKIILVRDIPLSESSTYQIAGKLLNYSMLDLPLDEHMIAGKHYLAVDAEQVRDAFAKWIRPDALVQVTLGPSPQ